MVVPPCELEGLEVSVRTEAVRSGYQILVFTNAREAPCTLKGHPAVRLLLDDSKQAAPTALADFAAPDEPGVIVLENGESGYGWVRRLVMVTEQGELAESCLHTAFGGAEMYDVPTSRLSWEVSIVGAQTDDAVLVPLGDDAVPTCLGGPYTITVFDFLDAPQLHGDGSGYPAFKQYSPTAVLPRGSEAGDRGAGTRRHARVVVRVCVVGGWGVM